MSELDEKGTSWIKKGTSWMKKALVA